MLSTIQLDNASLIIFSTLIMFLITLISLAYAIIYKQSKGIQYFIIANIVYLLFFVFVFFDAINGVLEYTILISSLDALTVTFWAIGIFRITNIKLPIKNFITLNLVNLFFEIFFEFVIPNINYQRAATPFIITILLLYTASKLSNSNRKKHLSSYRFISLIMIVFGIFKFIVAIYRTFVNVSTLTIFEQDYSISLFVFISLCFAVLINFSGTFLNHDILRSEVENMSFKDGLTGIHNRRHFYQEVEKLMNQHRRKQVNFAIGMIDIDNFKKINDTYGHDIGDEVLIQLATFFQTHIRKGDYVARFGGEEFILAIYVRNQEEVKLAFNRLFNRYQATPIFVKEDKITFSGGVAYASEGRSLEELIKIADIRLYKSKANGKDQMTYNN